MILADVVFSTEALAIVGAMTAALAGTIGVLFRLIVKSHASEKRDLVAQRESYRGMARDAMKHLEFSVNRDLASKGLPPFTVIAPVVPEHQSPATAQQQEVAALATLRARLVAMEQILGVEAR